MTAEQASVNVTIDGVDLAVPPGTLIIRAAETIGKYIPRFCDHPLLDPLGACRQCLVEVEGQRKPLTACTTPVAEGMVVKTEFASDLARDGQEGVLEFLLINHPLDCPMCDKGGECPLQDQALAYGPGGSRYIDLTPYPGLPAPIVVSSWGFQLRLSSPTDPRLQQFVDKFRASQKYAPEYGSPCTGGTGTPLQQ